MPPLLNLPSLAPARPRPTRSRATALAARLLAALAAGVGMSAQTPDFTDLSLEQLTQYEVTTLGRKNSPVFDVPAPDYVISNEEIQRAGALSLAESLRLAPGVQVSRLDTVNYAITVRGLNDYYASKLLVLLDGRSVHNQLSSGTNWSLLDLAMDDVSRIEVQRGPAGTLWGANAFNGVINVVTKNAHSTLGTLVSVATGDELQVATTVRHGFLLSPAAAARVYVKFQKHGDYGGEAMSGYAGWESRLAGGRFDWDRPGGGGLSVVSEYRELRTDSNTWLPSLAAPYFTRYHEQQLSRTVNLTARWNQPVRDEGQLSALASVERGALRGVYGDEQHTTTDLDAQYTFRIGARQEFIVGGTARLTQDAIRNTPYVSYADPHSSTYLAGAFVQDEIVLVPDRVTLTLGTKIERNTYSGWETQPSLRALWHPTKRQALWFAASRAARTPSRAEHGIRYFSYVYPPVPPYYLPSAIYAVGSADMRSEHVSTYELGHRFQGGDRFAIDTAVFYSVYPNLRGINSTVAPFDYSAFPPHFDVYSVLSNSISGHTFGGEVNVHWRPLPTLDLSGSITALRSHLAEIAPNLLYPDPSVNGLVGSSPREEYKFQASWRPHEHWEFDLTARHTGRLTEPAVDAYTGLDLRCAYQLNPNLSLELVGHDLLKRVHDEGSVTLTLASNSPIARSFYVRLTYRH